MGGHWIEGRELGQQRRLMTALMTQQLGFSRCTKQTVPCPPLVFASRRHELSSGAPRNSGMEVAQSVMELTTDKHQLGRPTQEAMQIKTSKDKPLNKHSWSDGKKTVSITLRD